ncbi:hypothetical protein BpHYR1_028976 [Brachionus plicatilis]|uniref:Uncharacterized protein n=1 Tax=Brachionus plicatilis TaxID=10195 RepID=A0A3M7RV20_BRAPC|nr:hypothetical protein BpHYR1_028976 [Brachionus plicatilis]
MTDIYSRKLLYFHPKVLKYLIIKNELKFLRIIFGIFTIKGNSCFQYKKTNPLDIALFSIFRFLFTFILNTALKKRSSISTIFININLLSLLISKAQTNQTNLLKF